MHVMYIPSTPPRWWHLAWLCAAATLASCATVSDTPVQRAPHLPGFGQALLQTSSRNADAQRLFAQGMAQAYAFNPPEAVRAFKAALAADPRCVLCAWGVAWQLGPNINAPDRGDLAEARGHIALAQRHAAQATPLEQALLDAMAWRYGTPADPRSDGPPGADICGPAGGGRAHPLDLEYASRLRGLADRLPNDPDVVSLYAEAELVATRDDWWHPSTGLPAGRVGEVADRVEHALRTHPQHTGLNHYMVHALDASSQAARAVPAADRLGALAPASPHLLHMPAHIYVKVGRYADAVQVNQQALAAEVALTASLKAQMLEPVWNWDRHNLHFLWFAALMREDADLALATARRLADMAATQTGPFAEYGRALPLLTLARLQRWPAVLAEPLPAGTHGVASGMGLALQGLALVYTGQLQLARDKASALDTAVAAAAAKSKTVRATEEDAGSSPFVTALQAQLQAELAQRAGNAKAAQAAWQRATAMEDELGGEPPLLAASTRVAQGQALLRAGQWAAAEAAFRDDLRLHPANPAATRGLQQAQRPGVVRLQHGKPTQASRRGTGSAGPLAVDPLGG